MRTFIVVTLLFIVGELGAQTYEIGLFAGGANNIGDVGKESDSHCAAEKLTPETPSPVYDALPFAGSSLK